MPEDPNEVSRRLLDEYAAHSSVGLYDYPNPGVPHYLVQFGDKSRPSEQFNDLSEAIKVAAAADGHSMVIEKKVIWYKDETWKVNQEYEQAIFDELDIQNPGKTTYTSEENKRAKEAVDRRLQAQSRLVDDPF